MSFRRFATQFSISHYHLLRLIFLGRKESYEGKLRTQRGMRITVKDCGPDVVSPQGIIPEFPVSPKLTNITQSTAASHQNS